MDPDQRGRPIRPDQPDGRGFDRPWENPEAEEEEPGSESPAERASEPNGEPDSEPVGEFDGETSLADRSYPFSDFTHDDYLQATTREYRGLAEDVTRAGTEEVTRQAVAASMPGVGSGLIGFDDVTGLKGQTEEELEHEDQQRASDVTVRIGTGIVLVGLFVGTLLLGPVWFTGFIAAVLVASLGEFYTTARSQGYAPVAIFGFAGALGGAMGAHLAGVFALPVAVGFTLVATTLFVAITGRRHPAENVAVTMMGMAWVLMLSFAIVIGTAENAVALIVLVVLLTASLDIGAFFIGRSFGRRPLAPLISPNKTVEGLVGGVIAVMAVSGILSTLPPFPISFVQSLWLAAAVAVLGTLGDLAESVVKRALDVKDMGTILPGHGGMFDRIDAFLFVLPGVYLVFFWFDLL